MLLCTYIGHISAPEQSSRCTCERCQAVSKCTIRTGSSIEGGADFIHRLLFDFHQYQNGIKADSVHATYLLHGTKSRPRPQQQQDGDVEMASSMPEQGQEEEPLSEDVPTTTLTIVSQENLECRWANTTLLFLFSWRE